ncbi:uncharacterized protein N7446_004446 [Penicillium canescens]|uniref:Xylanolytic transcriptional activator regulatory domain-containing protein n=1 Tax=Penicillium canescens TaxID=5083 RepID=A0AAD6N3D8_PENCN|nr:uncharacterized protein N7446_004446 [Penicillium canescens]KAJ6026952.1 hypothetical protein N7460_011769 [Penicillium canescens]KAJ6040236.1 hypothetical protein N7444_009141 [Penicillium canescens]KAJ6067409.1 hypothetical protein N7446_004446 [Penicillium canescens]
MKDTRPVDSSPNRSPGLLEDYSPGVNIALETPSVSIAQDNCCHISEVGDAASRDGLSGVNLHTNGTEFYGNSSNLAFLENLYARARNQAGSRSQNLLDRGASQPTPVSPVNQRDQPLSPETSQDLNGRKSGNSQLSIVNLLYNADYPGHPSPQSQSDRVIAAHTTPSVQGNSRNRSSNDRENNLAAVFPRLTQNAQLEIEKIFIGSYFANKHYIHPILSKGSFMRRCEGEAWPSSRRAGLFKGVTTFSGLYLAVVALGAINASPNETSLLDHFCLLTNDQTRGRTGAAFSALNFAKFYFGLARQTMGDLLESSCLETAQALLLLSVFRQNSLQPHSCYMYSGMAVRTAAAIGLGSSLSSLPPSAARREARRTWWCIYSHEIEMCCSSGRLDSMKELHYYQASIPKLKSDVGDLDPDAEDNDIAMIPVMVALSQINTEASHQLYHSTQRSMSEKSRLAMALDQRLLQWKANMPEFLDLDAHALNDPEWAFKQKLVLRLRYYNTRILIHKPFLVAATASTDTENDLSIHLHTCLTAARDSINMQYESFMHRIYIRTWWYNTTYALYGSMILLHVILSNYPGLPDKELLEDVEKSLEIFSSMEDIIVARRCAEMLREVLEVARTCLTRRRAVPCSGQHNAQNQTQAQLPTLDTVCKARRSSSIQQHTSANPVASVSPQFPGTAFLPTSGFSLDTPSSIMGHQPVTDHGINLDDEDFFFSLFSNETQQQPDRTRAKMLANLVNPSILEDFAFGAGNDFSSF